MQKRRVFLLLGVALLLIFISMQTPLFQSFLQKTVHTFSAPLLRFSASIREPVQRLRYGLLDYLSALENHDELTKKIAFLENELTRMGELEKENERLQTLLHFSSKVRFETTGARIIGYDVKLWQKSILLDKGTQEGINAASAVIAPAGLVGRVIEAAPWTSKAILLTDSDSRVSALTTNSRVQGILAGNGSSLLQFRYLSLDSNIQVGEEVISSGLGRFYPEGLRIGKIESIERDEDGLHLMAQVRPYVEFSKLEEVLCLSS